MNKLISDLSKVLDLLAVDNTDQIADKFIKYMDIILEYNKNINLTSITDPDEFVVKHFIDSLSCAQFDVVRQAQNIIDVGTGAGFPGIPLAIIFPGKHFLLADSLNKRVNILHIVSEALNLKNVDLIHGRAEELAQDHQYREQFDVSVARAVAPLRVLCEYCLPFVKPGGSFISMKAGDVSGEIRDARNAIKLLGGKYLNTESTLMNDYGYDHKIIFIKKINQTRAIFPRKAGIPVKSPL